MFSKFLNNLYFNVISNIFPRIEIIDVGRWFPTKEESSYLKIGIILVTLKQSGKILNGKHLLNNSFYKWFNKGIADSFIIGAFRSKYSIISV